jgi:electron transport complex protein RnfB
MSSSLIDKIDALLPQTQCGECSYGACRPYATAIAQQQEALNRCPPGGVETLKALGDLLQKDISSQLKEMEENTRAPTVAFIEESLCIGCTKCIQACPVDAIVGTKKQMHTVIQKDCTGCGLCLEPCPMDCIEFHPVHFSKEEKEKNALRWREQYERRQARLSKKSNPSSLPPSQDKKDYITAALERAALKKKSS